MMKSNTGDVDCELTQNATSRPEDTPKTLYSPSGSKEMVIVATSKPPTIIAVQQASSSSSSSSSTGVNKMDLEKQTATTEEDDDETPEEPYIKLSFKRRLIVFVGLFLAMLLAAMDQTIVAVVLSNIGDQFNARSTASWIATSYLVTVTAVQPLYGKLSSIFGRLEVLMFALGIFLIGSALCGTAQTMIWLIVARAITGIGGGGVMAMIIIITSDITTIRERGRYMGTFNLAWTVASVIGPIVGGVFADKVSWRWCFYINLPIGAVTVVTSLIFLRIPTQRSSWLSKLKRVDFLGSFIVVSGLVLLLLALSWGGKEYAWNSAVVVALLVVGLVLLVVFVFVEAYIPAEPIVVMSLFKKRSVSAAFVASLMCGMVMFSLIFYVPIFFSVTQNMSSIDAGLRLLPFQAPTALFALVAGQIMAYYNYYRTLAAFGFALTTIGNGVLTLLTPETSVSKQIGYLLISGIGLGFVLNPLYVMAQVPVKLEQVSIVSALILFARTIGGVLGLAISGTIFNNSLAANLRPLAAKYPEYIKTILSSVDDTQLVWGPDFPEDVREQVIFAYGKALHNFFIFTIPVAGLGFLAVLCAKGAPNHKSRSKNQSS
ncbi:hypothetical protein H4219_005099 [Mycoemilia scoparia]|uniref:Major facilitator superfamily (MFS) profile domain-containing protein n=1 Tax=Mycoemilia scoparia TaxID=417184 RepID=A0A9W7ZXH2_9FUNG|nr:hypothetical protein H4219_005099 [Mycoemilia scoparia]